MNIEIIYKSKTIPDLLFYAQKLHPNANFIVHNLFEVITYENFFAEVLKISNIIFNNYGKDNKFALLGNLDYNWITLYFSTLLSGNTVIPINNNLNNKELYSLIHQIGIETVFVSTEDINFDKTNNNTISFIDITALEKLTTQKYYSYEELRNNFDENSLAMIVFTSGTTGNNKGVMLSHLNITKDTLYSVEIMGLSTFQENDTIIPLLPPFHMFQITTGILAPLAYGVTLCLVKDFKDLKKGFIDFNPSTIIVVPAILEGLYKIIFSNMSPIKQFLFQCVFKANKILLKAKIDIRKHIFSNIHSSFGGKLKIIVCGGASVDKNLISWFNDIGITVLHGYGITECSPVVCCNRNTEYNVNSVGKNIHKYCEIKIIDKQVLIKGDIVFQGYYNRQIENEKTFSDGWFNTGDTGYIDKDGFLFLTGRSKNILVLNDGNNISPEEIEIRLEKFDIIEQAIIYMNDFGNGIEAEIFISPKVLTLLNQNQINNELKKIISSINKTMLNFKRVTIFRIAESKFETNSLGKIKRFKYISEDGRRRK